MLTRLLLSPARTIEIHTSDHSPGQGGLRLTYQGASAYFPVNAKELQDLAIALRDHKRRKRDEIRELTCQPGGPPLNQHYKGLRTKPD
jgi:hypothetical protein